MLYSKDLAILADTPADLKKKLKAFEDFCSIWDLEINVSKTNIVTFASGDRQWNVGFLYRGSPIEEVKNTYLRVPSSSSSLELDAANTAISRAAKGRILPILSRAKSDNWDGSLKLSDSILSATLLYGSQVWWIRSNMSMLSEEHKQIFASDYCCCPIALRTVLCEWSLVSFLWHIGWLSLQLIGYIAQNIAETCQKYFQSFIAIEILPQHFCQLLQSISLQHYNFKFLKYFCK